ncbi:MAG: hypothetical protein AAF602_30715, partial [Myxococcota bacterium]
EPHARPAHAGALHDRIWSPDEARSTLFVRTSTPTPARSRVVAALVPPHPPRWTRAAAIALGGVLGAALAMGLLIVAGVLLWVWG